MSTSGKNNGGPNPLRTTDHFVEQIKATDDQAWNRLVQLYSPLIYYWCQRLGLPEQEMPDVFQNIFYAVAKQIGRFDGSRKSGTFRGWLRTITKSKVMDHFRSTGRVPQPFGGTEAKQKLEQLANRSTSSDSSRLSKKKFDDVESAERQIEDELVRNALSNIRSHFRDPTWRAFWMVVIDGRSTQDVADQLSMKPGTVRVAKSRVLQRLRNELGES